MKDVLNLSIAAKPDYISAVRMFISAVAARMDFSLAQIEDIRTAVSEGCTLAMRTMPERIDIETCVGEVLKVTVTSVGANVTGDADANEFSMMLIEAMADEITLCRDESGYKGIEMIFNAGK